MTDLLKETLVHLEALVGFDTCNPPRKIGATDGIFEYLTRFLVGFHMELVDLGDGCISLLAVRGEPRFLFNFHVDTVPADSAWQTDPHRLQVTDERAIGLGACDIKGASACMLAAIARTTGDVALLFTSDEEAGSSRCVRAFCGEHGNRYAFEAVIVAEPTQAKAVLEHRGIVTCTGVFEGKAGHASSPTALEDNALHHAAAWVSAAVDEAKRARSEEHYRSLRGVCFNVGVIEGGIKPNIIAPRATVRWGIRPLPNQDADAVLARFQSCASEPVASEGGAVRWERGFYGPSLPANVAGEGQAGEQDVAPVARALAEEIGLEVGEPVDFWTEAALFSEAGYTAIVYGPGNIAQAHTAGEWVALEQLEAVAASYVRLIGNR